MVLLCLQQVWNRERFQLFFCSLFCVFSVPLSLELCNITETLLTKFNSSTSANKLKLHASTIVQDISFEAFAVNCFTGFNQSLIESYKTSEELIN